MDRKISDSAIGLQPRLRPRSIDRHLGVRSGQRRSSQPGRVGRARRDSKVFCPQRDSVHRRAMRRGDRYEIVSKGWLPL